MSRNKRLSVVAVIAVFASLMIPAGPARAATTYDVQFGADFFGDGIPGFSLRAFPTSLNVMKGDTIHFFGFGAPALLPAGQVPQEWTEQHNTFIGDDWFQLLADPDDGPDATKFNLLYFLSAAACDGTEVSPCVYDVGSGTDPFFPPETETGEVWITIDANPGDVIWGYTGPGNPPLRISVVANMADASTQAEVDARAIQQLNEDFNEAAALHNKFSAKSTWHRNEKGQKVYDAWAGPSRGSIELLAMYPKRLKVKKGQRVQWHFGNQNEVHNVVLSTAKAFDILQNTFIPVCDPDGDGGPGPDNPANFEAESEAELCPDISQLEFQLDPREIFGGGNGTFNGKNSDLEASGIKGRESFQNGLFNDDPFTLKFKTPSKNKQGYRYFCTIHGPFMGGRVKVKA